MNVQKFWGHLLKIIPAGNVWPANSPTGREGVKQVFLN